MILLKAEGRWSFEGGTQESQGMTEMPLLRVVDEKRSLRSGSAEFRA